MADINGSLAIEPTKLSGKINVRFATPPPPPMGIRAIGRVKPLSTLGKTLLNSLRISAFVGGVFLAFQTLLLGDWFWPRWYYFVTDHLLAGGALSGIALLILALPKQIPKFMGGGRIARIQMRWPRLWTVTRWGFVGFLLLMSLDIPIYFLIEGQTSSLTHRALTNRP